MVAEWKGKMTTNKEIKKRYNRAVGYLNIMRRAAISDYVDMKEDDARKDAIIPFIKYLREIEHYVVGVNISREEWERDIKELWSGRDEVITSKARKDADKLHLSSIPTRERSECGK